MIFSLWLSSTRKWTDDVGRDRVRPAWRPVSLPAQCDRSTMWPVQTRKLEHWQWNRWVLPEQFILQGKHTAEPSTQTFSENQVVSTVTCSKSSVSETSSQQATTSFRSSPRYPTLSRYPTPWIPHPLDTPPHESPIPQDTLPSDSKPLSPEIPYPLDTHPCPKKGHGTRDTLPPPPSPQRNMGSEIP